MTRGLRVLLVLVVAIFLIGSVGGAFVYSTLRRPLPQLNGRVTLKGLDGTIEIDRDVAGIPQIYAQTPHDLFLAQGYIAAQDRWWQMEFNRHIGLGRISELTGKNDSSLRTDIFIRTVGWNRAAQANLDMASKETHTILDAYSAGINAYIEGKAGPDLAVEYSVLALKGVNIPIEPWQPLHSIAWGVVMSWDLSGNMDAELNLARLYQNLESDKKLGLDRATVDAALIPDYPENHPTILKNDDQGLAPTVANYNNVPLISPHTDLAQIQTRLIADAPDTFSLWQGRDTGLGSNNWVVAGSHTQTGKPLLANDPHLGIRMPSIWYQVGLHCMQLSLDCPYDVTGFSFPGFPGVVIGHNQRIAWGVTNGTVDTQDLYAIKVDPNNPDQYEIDGKMEPMQTLTETVQFGDSDRTEAVKVRLTRFGPIITDAPAYSQEKMPLALKWVALSNPFDLIGSVIALNRAGDWRTFRAALTGWAMPAQNFVYADVDGNIGYQLPGLMPIRVKDHSGLTPMDGSTSQNDWKGFVPFENLPTVYNPSRGYIASANDLIAPPAYYAHLAEKLGDQFGKDSNYRFQNMPDWGYRAKRIEELLNAKDTHNIASFQSIQLDTYDGFAADLVHTLLKLDYGNEIPPKLIEWLGQWDYHDNISSGQAALFQAFWGQLDTKLWSDQLGYKPENALIKWSSVMLLNQPDNAWWDDVNTTSIREIRDVILRAALIDAYHEVSKKLGEDYRQWQWGALHKATFVSNPLGASGIKLLEGLVNGGPVAVGGSSETLNRSSWSPQKGTYDSETITSMRMIVDLSNFNNSQWIHSTGQSGHPASTDYRNMIDHWRFGDYDQMLWNRAAIKDAAVNTLVLEDR